MASWNSEHPHQARQQDSRDGLRASGGIRQGLSPPSSITAALVSQEVGIRDVGHYASH